MSAWSGTSFHRTQTAPAGADTAAWSWADRREGFSLDPSGSGRPSLHASYLHLHWAGHPGLAQRFAETASRFAATVVRPAAPADAAGRSNGDTRIDGIDLQHHGDHDLAPGLIDLAVNVMLPGPPEWLAEVLAGSMTGLGSYPDAAEARAAIAAAHGVPPEMVLPTAGGAEGFALIARTLTAARPLVVHPQFTEPEAALRAAGHAVQRWLLPLQPSTPPLADLPTWADAVFVGNPTNPTGWLHARADLLAAGAGRLLVVDEAFMDATDEAESLISPEMPGLLVLRSLSKTWGLAGLRVGYVVGDPALIARLEQAQPAWPISAPAAAAIVATSNGRGPRRGVRPLRRTGHPPRPPGRRAHRGRLPDPDLAGAVRADRHRGLRAGLGASGAGSGRLRGPPRRVLPRARPDLDPGQGSRP